MRARKNLVLKHLKFSWNIPTMHPSKASTISLLKIRPFLVEYSGALLFFSWFCWDHTGVCRAIWTGRINQFWWPSQQQLSLLLRLAQVNFSSPKIRSLIITRLWGRSARSWTRVREPLAGLGQVMLNLLDIFRLRKDWLSSLKNNAIFFVNVFSQGPLKLTCVLRSSFQLSHSAAMGWMRTSRWQLSIKCSLLSWRPITALTSI